MTPNQIGNPPEIDVESFLDPFEEVIDFGGGFFLSYPATSLSYLTLYSCRIVDSYLEIEGKLTPGSQSQWVIHLLYFFWVQREP